MAYCSSARQDSGDNEINIVLLGKTGNGKSATGNTILQRDVFKTSDSLSSVTKLAKLECSQNEFTSSIINVVDTPGLMDTDGDDVMSIIGQAMSLCPSGFNAVIIVVGYGCRFTKEEEDSIEILKQHLGPTFLQDFGIIIMTHGDSFTRNNKNISFTEWCRDESHKGKFGQLLTECNGRWVLFYNKGRKYEEQRQLCVTELLQIIRTQIQIRYRSHNFDIALETRNTILEKLDSPVLHKLIQEKISLLDASLHLDVKTDSFQFEDIRNRAVELHEAVNGLTDSPAVRELKLQIKLITDKIDDLKAEKNKEKQIEIQEQMKKDLRILRSPPSKSPVIIANIKLIFAKVAYPLGTVFSLGFGAEFLKNLVFEKMLDYVAEIKIFEKKNKKYQEAMKRSKENLVFEKMLDYVAEIKIFEKENKKYQEAVKRSKENVQISSL